MGKAEAPILVVAAALLNDRGLVCLQQRPDGKQHAGLWEFPGGKVEPGERPEQALVRELAEELAIRVDPAVLIACGEATAARLTIRLYLCRCWTGTVTAMEAAALVWADPAAIAAMAMPPLDYPLAEQLRHHLSTGAI